MTSVVESAPDGVPPALRLESLSVRLGASALLEGISLELRPGARLGIIGPSGAGKSTLLDVVAGERQVTSGRIIADGKDVTRWPLWRRALAGVSYVPQRPSVLPELTVRDNIEVFLELPACRGTREEPVALAERYELKAQLGTRASNLSGGERRRLELLRGLLPRPKVLLLDEPFAGLDPRRIQAFGRLLSEVLAALPTVLLLADHRLDETLSVVDEACLLLDGRLELRCNAGEFASHPSVRGRYLPE